MSPCYKFISFHPLADPESVPSSEGQQDPPAAGPDASGDRGNGQSAPESQQRVHAEFPESTALLHLVVSKKNPVRKRRRTTTKSGEQQERGGGSRIPPSGKWRKKGGLPAPAESGWSSSRDKAKRGGASWRSSAPLLPTVYLRALLPWNRTISCKIVKIPHHTCLREKSHRPVLLWTTSALVVCSLQHDGQWLFTPWCRTQGVAFQDLSFLLLFFAY